MALSAVDYPTHQPNSMPLTMQSHTTPPLEIELKSRKVQCEKLQNEVNDLKKEIIKTKRELENLHIKQACYKTDEHYIVACSTRPTGRYFVCEAIAVSTSTAV